MGASSSTASILLADTKTTPWRIRIFMDTTVFYGLISYFFGADTKCSTNHAQLPSRP
jgi:hypothetical protein